MTIVLLTAFGNILEWNVRKLEHVQLELFLEARKISLETGDLVTQHARLSEKLVRVFLCALSLRYFLSDAVARCFSLFNRLNESTAFYVHLLRAIDICAKRIQLAATAHALTKHIDMLAYH